MKPFRAGRWAAVIPLAACLVAHAGQIAFPGNLQATRSEYVVYTADPQVVSAGSSSVIELRFHVLDGFHINSHKPVGELLIPTQVNLQEADGVTVGKPSYPAGVPYSFNSAPQEKLDVYTGSFVVKLPVVTSKGEHTLQGTLKYQACDQAACYPPKTLSISVFFVAR